VEGGEEPSLLYTRDEVSDGTDTNNLFCGRVTEAVMFECTARRPRPGMEDRD
jgi:hypothetical protein